MDKSVKINRRLDWDGLRGLAVLMVLVYHIESELLPNAIVAMDIFFVLSGFLITMTYLRRLLPSTADSDGSSRPLQMTDVYASVLPFYLRRFRRLQPGAFICLVMVALVFVRMVSEVTAAATKWDFLSAALFVSNWHFINNEFNYWAATSSPILHFWSLSAEEQFYFVLPLLVCLVAIFARREEAKFLRSLWWTLLAVACFSIMYSLYLTVTDHQTSSYLYMNSLSRACQMSLGSVIAIDIHAYDKHMYSGGIGAVSAGFLSSIIQKVKKKRYRLYLVELVVIISFLLLVLTATLSSWSMAMIATALTVIALTVGCNCEGKQSESALSWLLSMPGLPYLGRISYSVYLYHYPIIWAGDRAKLLPPTAERLWRFSCCTVLSIAAGVAGYEIIERPFMKISLNSVRNTVLGTVSLVAIPLTLVLCINVIFVPPPDHAHSSTEVPAWNDDWLIDTTPDPIEIMVIGDSWAQGDMSVMRKYLKNSTKIQLSGFTSAGCPPLTDTAIKLIKPWKDDGQRCIDETARIDRSLVDNSVDIIIVSTIVPVFNGRDTDEFQNMLSDGLQRLKEYESFAKYLVVLLPIPLCEESKRGYSIPDCIAALPKGNDEKTCYCEVDEQQRRSKERYIKTLRDNEIDFLDLEDTYIPDGRTIGNVNGILVMKDFIHLSYGILETVVNQKLVYALEHADYALKRLPND